MTAALLGCTVIIAVIVLSCLYSAYVRLIQSANKVREALSSVDVQLKKRYDLIPNILKIASKFMEHEKTLTEEITNLRMQALKIPKGSDNFAQKIELDKLMQEKMSQFMIAVENYPQLKSDQTMIVAMQTYNEVEEHICASRRFYNSAVNALNNLVDIFPSSIVASMCQIKRAQFFEIEEVQRQPINADSYLK